MCRSEVSCTEVKYHVNEVKYHVNEVSCADKDEAKYHLSCHFELLSEKARWHDGRHGPIGSVLWAIDETVTRGGAGELRRWLLNPLQDVKEIESRLDSVDALRSMRHVQLEPLVKSLKGISYKLFLCSNS